MFISGGNQQDLDEMSGYTDCLPWTVLPVQTGAECPSTGMASDAQTHTFITMNCDGLSLKAQLPRSRSTTGRNKYIYPMEKGGLEDLGVLS